MSETTPTKPHENIAKLNKITIPKKYFYTFVICITFKLIFAAENIQDMPRPKKEPTAIFPLRYNKERLERLRKRHGRKIHAYLKTVLDKIDKTKRIPDQDND